MSSTCTPSRVPLRDIGVVVNQTPKQGNASHTLFKNSRTPKTSPGPALMLAIRLSAKKELLKKPPLLELEDKENCAEHKAVDGVLRFRHLLSTETERITKLCNDWEDLLQELQSSTDSVEKCSDSVLGDIRTTVGQGRLIMRERFHQFRGLVDNSEFGTSEKPVTCQDLQGFWDMIYFQVEDVDAKFRLLTKCQEANWDQKILLNETVGKSTKKVTKKKTSKKSGGSTKLSDAARKRHEEFAKKRAEARKRLADAKAEMKAVQQEDVFGVVGHISGKERMTFDAGFFKIDSPIKSPYSTSLTPSNRRHTPCGSSMKKQTCTPGSISKLLATVNIATTSNLKPIKNNPEVSKKLEFVGNNESEGLDTNITDQNCVVEILIDDGLSVQNLSEEHAQQPDINTVEQCENAISEKTASAYIDASTDINGDIEANGAIACFPVSPSTCSFSEKNNAILGIDISPPALFSNCFEKVNDEELKNHELVDSPRSVSSEKPSSENDAKVNGLPTQAESGIDNAEIEAANLSVILDEATRNFKKMSSILCPIDETPHRDGNLSVRKDNIEILHSVGKAPVEETVSLENEKSPNKSALQNLLLETMENMKSQLETLQTLNTNYLKTPKSSEVEELRSKVESLQSENSKLQSALNEERKSRKNDGLSNEEKLTKLLFEELKPIENEASDIAYKPYYYRLLAKIKFLETKLQRFRDVGPELLQAQNLISENTKTLNENASALKSYEDELNKKDKRLKQAAECENSELIQCKTRNEELTVKLVDVEEKFTVCEKSRLDGHSELTSLRSQFEAVNLEKENFESALQKINEEKLSLCKKVSILEDKLETTASELNEKSEKCQALEEKINCLGEEIKSAFTEFQTVIQKRDEVIDSQQNQIERLNDDNTKLCQDRKMLRDKIETLEYVEDEMRSVQEQLVETEQSLAKSKNVETQLNIVVDDLKNEIDGLNQEIEISRLENSNLQEELDVAKAEAHYMVQQREEELVYGNTRMNHILTMMQELHTGLKGMITPEQSETVKDGRESEVCDSENSNPATPFQCTSTPGTFLKTFLQSAPNFDASPLLKHKDLSEEPCNGGKSPIKKDSNSIMWKVDKGSEMFQSIIQACADVQLQFHRKIDNLKFDNSVLCKQLATMKGMLSDLKKGENELEKVLRKRIERLTKETEEKSNKLEDNSRLMRMLSDQNMELAKYKLKYEELLLDESIGRRRSRSAKRRSSSAGSLKFIS